MSISNYEKPSSMATSVNDQHKDSGFFSFFRCLIPSRKGPGTSQHDSWKRTTTPPAEKPHHVTQPPTMSHDFLSMTVCSRLALYVLHSSITVQDLVTMNTSAPQINPLGAMITTPPATAPERVTLPGRSVTLAPLESSHGPELYPLVGEPSKASLWDYMLSGPFFDEASFQSAITKQSTSTFPDTTFYALISPTTGTAIGYLSLMRCDLTHRTIEIGSLMFSPEIQRSTVTTEAIYLIACYAFDVLGFRRLEWKCNDLNAPSRRAAKRLGFVFEGLFRQHMIVRGRNRDTAWFSMLDSEWPTIRLAFETWLDPQNFDSEGRQRRRLEDIMEELETETKKP